MTREGEKSGNIFCENVVQIIGLELNWKKWEKLEQKRAQRAGEGMQMGIMLSKLRIASDFGNISWSGPRLAQNGIELYGSPDHLEPRGLRPSRKARTTRRPLRHAAPCTLKV